MQAPRRSFAALLSFVAAIVAGSGQTVQPDAPAMPSTGQTTFQSKVNLVIVPVVVRDAQGHAVGNLEKTDFELFDKGKPQVISKFSVEKAAGDQLKPNVPGAPPMRLADTGVPSRFVAYLFDDLHLASGDLVYAQKAATKHISTELQTTDRAAVYTTSGRITLEFTDDRAKLQETIMRIRPVGLYQHTSGNCPDLSYYMADRIINKNDQQLLQAAVAETMACASLTPQQQQMAAQMVQAAASQEIGTGEQDTRVTLLTIKDIARRMATMPGQRQIILVSPGFVTPSVEALEETTDILDRATRGNVMISSVDARGLFTATPDISQRSYDGHATMVKNQYDREAALAQEDVLAELASGTGGTFFHDNNDLYEGLRRVATAPEYRYLLGFSPDKLKNDGTFHKLKIVLVERRGLNVQARLGYYAPKHATSQEDTSKTEIADAVFSREEIHDLPVDLHTQFFKPDPTAAKLTVLARIDLRQLRFKKANNRNNDDLTIVTVLFDTNGNYITGVQKTLQMRLLDGTLQKLSGPVTLKSDFNVKPGTYVVRLVVRDAQDQMMAAQNGVVDIP